MNNLETTKMQTPIEIALGVDENGMTTASKLYSFLELNPSNYSKWCKTNITENEFAEEIVEDHVFKDEETDDGIIYICDSNEDKEKLPYYKEVMKKKRNHPNRPKLNDSQSKQ